MRVSILAIACLLLTSPIVAAESSPDELDACVSQSQGPCAGYGGGACQSACAYVYDNSEPDCTATVDGSLVTRDSYGCGAVFTAARGIIEPNVDFVTSCVNSQCPI